MSTQSHAGLVQRHVLKGLRWDPRIYILNRFLGAADATSPWTNLRVVRGWETSPTFWNWLVDLIAQVQKGIKLGYSMNYITLS